MSSAASAIDGHDHPHNPHLAHHFESMEQQHNSAKLGMWIFLVTEILLFSGLFLAYGAYRAFHPEVFNHASRLLSLPLGGFNTIVLIGSSLTMALAVREAQLGRGRLQALFLLSTLALAGVFLVVKYFEYSHKFHVGLLPGRWFAPHGHEAHVAQWQNVRIFFGIYFLMTGLHGIHVLMGMAAIGWLWLRARRGEFSAAYYTPVEVVGLYWHLVDIIWIFLFPMLYLIDRSPMH
ncbi:MAG: Cytochrome c oxidase subunit 3 [candidate division BRC1 bacterium ADurb.BinA292]|nr:MAG: Cytochrome c oxidase subunit 3 [candidate division BRC1 bacterium ADurb.BinA292]